MKKRLERLEAVQNAVLEISRLSAACSDIVSFLQSVHQITGRIMYAANFYVALFDHATHSVRYVYEVDEFDTPLDPEQRFPLDSPEASPTAWVILNRRPLVMTAEEDAARERENKTWGTGTRAEHWMGHPLLDHQRQSLGVMVVQSYDPTHIYTEEDQKIFGLIAAHVSAALQSLFSVDRLEQAVRERTLMLEHEIEERKKAETLQRVLFQIAELSVQASEDDRKFSRLHEIISQLVPSKNFMVALFHEDSQEFSIEYSVDEVDGNSALGKRFPLGSGMTSYVIQNRQTQLINRAQLLEMIDNGTILALGSLAVYSWIGAPLIVGDAVYGVIILQSYDAAVTYSEADKDLIAFVAHHVAAAFARMKADENNRVAKEQLKLQNDALNQMLTALKKAQKELVDQDRLASLGRLVAGVAHEINTPLGICVTAASHIVEELALVRKELEQERLDESGLNAFFDVLDQSLRILMTNCLRGAALVRSFKQVAVDQSSESIREFDLRAYLDEVLLSLQPKLKGHQYKVQIDCPPGILMRTYPGAVSQILTNMLTNSLMHGFEGRDEGHILIRAHAEQDNVHMRYADDGVGMSQAALEKLFEPFYTTKRGQGGSGLGAHISYNLVTGPLGGTLNASSSPGQGLTYEMQFPRIRTVPPSASGGGRPDGMA